MKSPTLNRALVPLLALLVLAAGRAHASTAYGTINNFDTVNDTGRRCHGFEIEIEDIHSRDITYTYDWNHYGKPEITEDNAVPAHPRVRIRYASRKNPDGSWAAFTAVPSAPIQPTNGHQFTNPSVNFGGEHFGVGYYGAPTAIKYHWLVDDGAGNLIQGPPVQVATPTFTYNPPVGAAPAAVQAVIEPPEPPEVHPLEFGPAVWVKEIRTETHNDREVKLRDLVSDDPDFPPLKDWRNGEPDEVEVEWQLLQTEFNQDDGGANGELIAELEDLPDGDEVITRRYEFYAYTGPIDEETGEAIADEVAADGVHGVGIKTSNDIEYDLSTIEVVGVYLGAQMSAFDADASVGLTEHVQDGRLGVPYAERRVVIAGQSPFIATTSGALPAGMTFDTVTGILSGTPTATGVFAFTVNASDAATPQITKNYTFTISAPAAPPPPPQSTVDTGVSPPGSGATIGDGPYINGALISVVASPAAGMRFSHWSDNGATVSYDANYSFDTDVNRALVAHFEPIHTLSAPTPGALQFEWPVSAAGWVLQETATLDPSAWTDSPRPVSTVGSQRRVLIPNPAGHRFFRLIHP